MKTLPIEQTLLRPSNDCCSWALLKRSARTFGHRHHENPCQLPLESGYMLVHTLKARGNVSYFHTIYGHKSIYSARWIVWLRYNKKIHSTKPYYIVTATGLCVCRNRILFGFSVQLIVIDILVGCMLTWLRDYTKHSALFFARTRAGWKRMKQNGILCHVNVELICSTNCTHTHNANKSELFPVHFNSINFMQCAYAWSRPYLFHGLFQPVVCILSYLYV